MTTFNVPLSQIQMFFLIFLRVGAIMMMVPVFGSKNIPVLLKAGLVLSMTIMLFPMLKLDHGLFFSEIIPFGICVVGEIMLGVIIGLSVKLIFAGIQLAGQISGYQMGFAIANVMDPQTGAQASIIAQLQNMTAILIFLSINAHHWFLQGVVESFHLIPLFDFRISSSLIEHFMKLGGNMFIIAVKVGAPVMAALLLTSVALGLVARTVPRMNVFLVAMPLKIAMGLLFVAFSLPYLSSFLKEIFNGLGSDILQLMRIV